VNSTRFCGSRGGQPPRLPDKRRPGVAFQGPLEGVVGGGMTHQPAGRSVPYQGSVSRRRPRMPS
jgi:hypothetical protein